MPLYDTGFAGSEDHDSANRCGVVPATFGRLIGREHPEEDDHLERLPPDALDRVRHLTRGVRFGGPLVCRVPDHRRETRPPPHP